MVERLFGNERNAALFVTLGVASTLLIGAFWVLNIVVGLTRLEADPVPELLQGQSPIYVDFRADVDEYVSAGSYVAMAAYQNEYEQPRNVRVLEGLNTQEVNGYMLNHFVAGLNVNCTYCHNINNFAAGPEWEGDADPLPEGADAPHPNWEANKGNARRHLELVQDLNRNWVSAEVLNGLTEEKQPSGAQMTCATCHNGQAQPLAWPADQAVVPDNFRLPLVAPDGTLYDLTAENQGILNVNGRTDISLDTVNYQQQVMYHMNSAMNVGCTHCHNSRYFPSREVPAIHYAQHMLEMTQYISVEYAESLGGQELSCTICHQGNIIPGGAAASANVLPPSMRAAIPSDAGDVDDNATAMGN